MSFSFTIYPNNDTNAAPILDVGLSNTTAGALVEPLELKRSVRYHGASETTSIPIYTTIHDKERQFIELDWFLDQAATNDLPESEVLSEFLAEAEKLYGQGLNLYV